MPDSRFAELVKMDQEHLIHPLHHPSDHQDPFICSRGHGVTIQDLGRPGHMHESVPAGGALVRSLLVAANRHVAFASDD